MKVKETLETHYMYMWNFKYFYRIENNYERVNEVISYR